MTNFLREEREEIDDTVTVAAAVSGSILVVASGVAWVVAGRILRPIRVLTETAHAITETDLQRRIPVRGGDEIAELAATFNGMLDRLESAFATQRSFVDDAGHELRTPITIVRGHLELLGDDPGEREETVALVTDELDRMARIVDELLVLARAEQPDFVQPRELDLAELTIDLYAKATALGDRRWELERAGEGSVWADGQRLTQAVMNLATNAAQHTGTGDVITLGSASGDGAARLWVRDTGVGIDGADHERIFQRFARAGDGRRRSQGAGLGLAIVAAIAEAHHGRVELESRPGRGSTFTVVVPTEPTRRSSWPAS